MFELWGPRVALALVVAAFGAWSPPFGLGPARGAALGAVFAAIIVAAELRLREASLHRVIGAILGATAGLILAALASSILAAALGSGAAFSQAILLVACCYLGLVVGANKGESLNLSALPILSAEAVSGSGPRKILDTSVIIDGRIADIAEAGFLDGSLTIPQFVLWELQTVADSADSLKRNRGRRGLDVLERLNKMKKVAVEIVENDYPALREVDQKLIELAKEIDGKIVTNDFNLNKLAQLQGVHVLNINELANAIKPVVLPGEIMKVFILKEGKEHNQGVAYLDDGTMVVVDNARDQISKTVDISVTSVLQTTAGKMIFGRFGDESAGPPPSRGRGTKSSGQTRAYVARSAESAH
ncbi:MAG: TRAM domain-containing protein [Bryobacterales bacterium]|nr:TRAM domain-containing protein [Acidobacteriota bacterium]MCB9383406.1 TRAM domain-containing protein [Bryobacterales bacterium]